MSVIKKERRQIILVIGGMSNMIDSNRFIGFGIYCYLLLRFLSFFCFAESIDFT